MQDFRNLTVWHKAHQLTLRIHRVAARMPRGESAGLRGQMLRASASVPANISEGCGRRTNGELARFADIANASVTELEYHIVLARDLALIPESEYRELTGAIVEVRKMLIGLAKAMR